MNPSILFNTENDALNNTNWDDVTDSQSYLMVANGTWWAGVKAKNTTYIVTKSVVVSCSGTTTTTTTTVIYTACGDFHPYL